MYSSGTTGLPKCMVHGAGGTLIQHLKEHQLLCDLKPDDRLFYFTTCGWMMWNWLMSGLATGATLILYDGAPLLRRRPILWDMAAADSEVRVIVIKANGPHSSTPITTECPWKGSYARSRQAAGMIWSQVIPRE